MLRKKIRNKTGMLEYVAKLRKETDNAIDGIESSDSNILEKIAGSLACIGRRFRQIKKVYSFL